MDNEQFKNLMYLKGALIESCMFCTERSVGFLFLPSGCTRATTHCLAHSEIKKRRILRKTVNYKKAEIPTRLIYKRVILTVEQISSASLASPTLDDSLGSFEDQPCI